VVLKILQDKKNKPANSKRIHKNFLTFLSLILLFYEIIRIGSKTFNQVQSQGGGFDPSGITERYNMKFTRVGEFI
jgi:hypothetical protein